MTRYAEIEKALREIDEECGACHPSHDPGMPWHSVCVIQKLARKALALPEDSLTVNAELYWLAVKLCDRYMRSEIESLCVNNGFLGFILEARKPWYQDEVNEAARYLSLREASGDPMPYKVVRDGDKVRFE